MSFYSNVFIPKKTINLVVDEMMLFCSTMELKFVQDIDLVQHYKYIHVDNNEDDHLTSNILSHFYFNF